MDVKYWYNTDHDIVVKLFKMVSNNAGKDLEKIVYFHDVDGCGTYKSTWMYVKSNWRPLEKLGEILYG